MWYRYHDMEQLEPQSEADKQLQEDVRELEVFFLTTGRMGSVPTWYWDLLVAAHFSMLPSQAQLWRELDVEHYQRAALAVKAGNRAIQRHQGVTP